MKDERGRMYLLTWKSKIEKRVARPTKEVKAMGLEEAIELLMFLRDIGKESLNAKVGIMGI